MANKLSFSVAVNLLTENFKRGEQELKNGLRNIQMQAMTMFAVFGAGSLGVGEFVSKLIDTARETSRVSTALKNISGDAKTFGESQKFLIDLSKKYGLYINDLTSNFSKFTASANMAGMSQKNQEKIFESLSRATVNYGLSAEESNGIFLALSQMMGKGTIQAQELKLQMGEKLPVALAAMAKAANTSVAGLTKMMEQGKLTTAILPQFADELNKLTQNANLDNIETAFNGIKNKFKELTDILNVSNIYKNLLDKTNSSFKWIIDNIKILGDTILNIVGTVIVGKAFKAFKDGLGVITKAAQDSYISQAIAAEKLAVEEELLNVKLTKSSQKRYLAESLAAAENTAKQEFSNRKISSTGVYAFKSLGTAISGAFKAFAPMIIISGIIAIIQHVSDLIKKQNEIKAIWGDYQKSIKNAGGTSEEIVKMQSLQRVMNNKFESQKNINSAQRELMGMLGIEKNNQTEINKAVAKRIELLKETARAQLYTDSVVNSEKKIDDLSNSKNLTTNQSQELVRMYVKGGGNSNDNYLKIVNKLNSWNAGNEFKTFAGGYNKDEIINFIKEIGGLNRVVKDANNHIDSSIKKTTTKVNNTVPDKKDKKTDLEKAEEEYTKEMKKLTLEKANQVITEKEYKRAVDAQNKETYKKIGGLDKNAANNKIFIAAKKGVDNPYETDIKKIENDYTDALNDLILEKKLNLKTSDEYDNALKTLINSTVKSIFANDKINIAGSKFAKELIKQKEELNKKDFSLPAKPEIDHTFDYSKNNTEKLEDQHQQNDDYIKAIEKTFSDAGVKDIKKQMADAGGDLSKLKAQFNGQADSLIDELNNALKKAPNLAEALKIAKVKEDIKDLRHQLNTGLYSDTKEVANAAKNLYNSWKAVNDTFSKVDAKPWEKILAVWDAMTNTVDNIMTIVKSVQTLLAITEKLTQAKIEQKKLDDKANKPELIKSTLATLKTTDKPKVDLTDLKKLAGSGDNSTEDDSKQTDADKTKVAANSAVAISGAIASASDLPFPFNLIEMASAAASAASLLGNLPKFANGGMIGGNSFQGDKVLAMVNSGEGVLTANGVNNLGSLIAGQAQTHYIVLDTKLNGKDIYLSQKNYNAIKSKVN